MSQIYSEPHELKLDPQIRDWVLIPIMIVMVLIGILRHYLTLLLQSPQNVDIKAIREQQALKKAALLRQNADFLPFYSWNARRIRFGQQMEQGDFLKNKSDKKDKKSGEMPPNPMGDPQQMDVMMEGMKKNLAMMIPQMIMMGWINYFFSGFVLVKLPFPLTMRFKAMLQRGIDTPDMDVTWVSSLSWYFLNLFGLKGIFGLILGDQNSADGSKDMQNMAMPQQQAMGQSPDMTKFFKSEKESLDIVHHKWNLQDIDERVSKKMARFKYMRLTGKNEKKNI